MKLAVRSNVELPMLYDRPESPIKYRLTNVVPEERLCELACRAGLLERQQKLNTGAR
jgi:hypothetical protein